ncbi:hypothetical protein CN918_30085 [Priestia megaterium]|nr:hypothetical protein CN918_30085 [Priestia megaterium]
MKQWTANEMEFVQVLNMERYKPEEENFTRYALIYRSPDNESISLTINVEEGKVFLEGSKLNSGFFISNQEQELFIARGQQRFDNEVDMGIEGGSFVYGWGGAMPSLSFYNNPNINYIPLVFPENEKFNNPRYREKVERSLIDKGAIFIYNHDTEEKFLAVVQRKEKPRNLRPFHQFLPKELQIKISKPKSISTSATTQKTAEIKKWKAADMVYRYLWKNDKYEPHVRNFTKNSIVYQTPNGKNIYLAVNIEEGKVFVENKSQVLQYIESEHELTCLVQIAQEHFDTKEDMGKSTKLVFEKKDTPAKMNYYTNDNITYIPLVFPDNEKFNNPKYKEKVVLSLVEKGAIFIKKENNEVFLAVIQRKEKPRDLRPFLNYIPAEFGGKPSKSQKVENTKEIRIPGWLANAKGITTTEKWLTISVTIKTKTAKGFFFKYKHIEDFLPDSQVKYPNEVK